MNNYRHGFANNSKNPYTWINTHFLQRKWFTCCYEKYMKKLLSILFLFVYWSTFFGWVIFAWEQKPFEIIPDVETIGRENQVEKLWTPWVETDFRSGYNTYWDKLSKKKDLWAQLASWIVTRDTVLILLTNLVKFISNASLVFGSLMFIYAWYLYVTSIFTWDNSGKANEAIKNAVIWVVIVIFSYAIQKIVIEGFLS